MLHLIYYLDSLASSLDVREQNKDAFELEKLAAGESELVNMIQTSSEQEKEIYEKVGDTGNEFIDPTFRRLSKLDY